MASVGITSNQDTKLVDINGGKTIGQALALFFRCQSHEVQARIGANVVKLNGATVEVPGGLNGVLQDRDYISLYTAEIARGGVKGATI